MKFEKPLSIGDLLSIIKDDVIAKGNLQAVVTGINEIHSVENGDLSFVDHPKYYEKVLNSVATVILINKDDVSIPKGKAILITKDPLEAFLKVVRHFVKFKPQKEAINHNAHIGENTIIQPNVFIGENVTIGKNCIIHSNVSIYSDTVIGDNVIIHSGCVIGGDAFYFQKRSGEGWKKLESCGSTMIEDDVEIGCNVSIDKGVSGVTLIGAGTKFDNLVQIGHDTRIGKRCLIGSQTAIAGCSFIDDDCAIWARVSINKDLYVAKNTVILALTAVDKSIHQPGTTLFGAPAGDPRTKWKEMAFTRKLPELFEDVENIQNDINELKKRLSKK